MGLVGYFRIFIKGFSRIASPITYFQNKGVEFEWTSKCEEIFRQLKEILTSAPILNIANPNEYFFVCTDACKEGLDGVLSQRDNVVCYESKKLKWHERNYATNDLKLEFIVHELKMWSN
jgi:hypothetical protein